MSPNQSVNLVICLKVKEITHIFLNHVKKYSMCLYYVKNVNSVTGYYHLSILSAPFAFDAKMTKDN